MGSASCINISSVVVILASLGGGQCPRSWLGNQLLLGPTLYICAPMWPPPATRKLDGVQCCITCSPYRVLSAPSLDIPTE